METVPPWRDERLIEFVVDEVFGFIKQTFLFPVGVDFAIAGLEEGGELGGEMSSI